MNDEYTACHLSLSLFMVGVSADYLKKVAREIERESVCMA